MLSHFPLNNEPAPGSNDNPCSEFSILLSVMDIKKIHQQNFDQGINIYIISAAHDMVAKPYESRIINPTDKQADTCLYKL